MQLTRLETKKLKQAVQEALKHLVAARQILTPHLVLLTEAERRDTIRPREAIRAKGREFAREMAAHTEMATAIGYDPEAVIEDLDNVEAIGPLASELDKLTQLVDDSRLTWLAEADEPTRCAYHVAKAGAKVNPNFRPVVDALASLYATTRRTREPKPE